MAAQPTPTALAVARAEVTPRRVRAGRRVTVALVLGAVPSGGTAIRCKAWVRGGGLHLVGQRFVTTAGEPRAVCVWRVPKRASGRLLWASVGVTAGAATVSRRVSRRIA